MPLARVLMTAVLTTNQPMLKLVKFLGFSSELNSDDPMQMMVRKDLLASDWAMCANVDFSQKAYHSSSYAFGAATLPVPHVVP
jgi:hypothetical protein